MTSTIFQELKICYNLVKGRIPSRLLPIIEVGAPILLFTIHAIAKKAASNQEQPTFVADTSDEKPVLIQIRRCKDRRRLEALLDYFYSLDARRHAGQDSPFDASLSLESLRTLAISRYAAVIDQADRKPSIITVDVINSEAASLLNTAWESA